MLGLVQGGSRFLGPWRLATEGTDRDIAKFVGAALLVTSTPVMGLAIWAYLREIDGSVGEKIWMSRATIAWFAFCLHALVLMRKAPVVPDRP